METLKPAARKAFPNFKAPEGFVPYLGVSIDELEDGIARLSLPLRREHTNRQGIAHGGVIMTLLDVALCSSARTQHPDAKGVLTITMSTAFIGPGTGRLLAEGRVLRRGRSTIFTEAEVRNEDGSLVATAIATVRALAPEK